MIKIVSSGADSNKDVYPILVDSSGRQIITKEGAYTKVWKYVSLADTNETTVWDPTSGSKFVATDIIVGVTANGTCTLRDGTTGDIFMVLSVWAPWTIAIPLGTPIQSSTADNILTAQASAITQYVTVCGYEI